jgi:SAM-dependent methyltransferase
MHNKIEILPVSLLDTERSTINELKALAAALKLDFGWHYLLDLSWIIRNLELVDGQNFIDAGAGTGVMQWYLANKGANVISVDRDSRANLNQRFRRRFNIRGLRRSDLSEASSLSGINQLGVIKSRLVDFVDMLSYKINSYPGNKGEHAKGEVIIYNQDLENLDQIPDDSIDAIVAVSSLEHNSPDGLRRVVAELLRVLKPGRAIFATLGAAKGEDWFHEASQGWCYTETTLRKVFNISPDIQTNFDQYDRLFDDLRENKELQDNLASFYFKSDKNGMPWGEWNPQYQPVGICKIKETK